MQNKKSAKPLLKLAFEQRLFSSLSSINTYFFRLANSNRNSTAVVAWAGESAFDILHNNNSALVARNKAFHSNIVSLGNIGFHNSIAFDSNICSNSSGTIKN